MAKRQRKHWTLIETHQTSSADAVKHLAQQSRIFYRPLYRPARADSKGVRVSQSLFQGYMFVQVTREDWSPVRNTRGVKRLHMSGDYPCVILDADIEYIRGREDEMGYFVPEHEEPPVFQLDETVRGIRGLFEDKVGIYKGLGNSKRDSRRVLFDILGRSVQFEVNVYDLATA